jgi:ectoine hydroxylase-related dioxygenase (phytanoyl-CoA dioxygenase family)
VPGLSPAQRSAYLRDGFLIVDGVLPTPVLDTLIAELEETVDRNARAAIEQGLLSDPCEAEPFPRRLARLVTASSDPVAADRPSSPLFRDLQGKRRSPAMFALITHPALLDVVESIIGPEILAHPQFNIRAKLPEQDRSVVPWHQDLGYLQKDAERTFMVNFWVPLVDATTENGCLEVISGSHRAPLVDHTEGLGPAANFRGITEGALPPGHRILCPVRKGGILLIQHKTIHRSLPNASDHVRWSLDIRYSDPAMPTGRDEVPGFLARSATRPAAVARSIEDWNRVMAAGDPLALSR